MEYLKNWTHFEFQDGNSYITFTEKRRKEILEKYGDRATKIKDGYYYIYNKKEKNACNGE